MYILLSNSRGDFLIFKLSLLKKLFLDFKTTKNFLNLKDLETQWSNQTCSQNFCWTSLFEMWDVRQTRRCIRMFLLIVNRILHVKILFIKQNISFKKYSKVIGWGWNKMFVLFQVQFPMSPTKRKSVPVTTFFGGRLNKRAPPTKMAVAMGPSY